MINIFNQNYEELGSLDKNLILQTQGKVKIRYGKKFIDLLNNNGELNVEVPEIFKKVSSKDEITSDGIYTIDDEVCINANGVLIELSPSSEETFYVSFSEDQKSSEEQKKQAQKNIGLTFNTLQEAHSAVDNGIVFVKDNIYHIDNQNNDQLLTLITPLKQINDENLGNPLEKSILYYKNGKWKYQLIESLIQQDLPEPLNEIINLDYPDDDDTYNLVWSLSDGWEYKKSGGSNKVPQKIEELHLELQPITNNKFKILYWKQLGEEIQNDNLSLSFNGNIEFQLDPTSYYQNDGKNYKFITFDDNISNEDKSLSMRIQCNDMDSKVITVVQKAMTLQDIYINSDKDTIPNTSDNSDDLVINIQYWKTYLFKILTYENIEDVTELLTYYKDSVNNLTLSVQQNNCIIDNQGEKQLIDNRYNQQFVISQKNNPDPGSIIFTLSHNDQSKSITVSQE